MYIQFQFQFFTLNLDIYIYIYTCVCIPFLVIVAVPLWVVVVMVATRTGNMEAHTVRELPSARISSTREQGKEGSSRRRDLEQGGAECGKQVAGDTADDTCTCICKCWKCWMSWNISAPDLRFQSLQYSGVNVQSQTTSLKDYCHSNDYCLNFEPVTSERDGREWAQLAWEHRLDVSAAFRTGFRPRIHLFVWFVHLSSSELTCFSHLNPFWVIRCSSSKPL